MTQDEIIEMAVKAGIAQVVAEANIDIMEAFAKLVAAKEREACARELDIPFYGEGGKECAAAIRERGEQA